GRRGDWMRGRRPAMPLKIRLPLWRNPNRWMIGEFKFNAIAGRRRCSKEAIILGLAESSGIEGLSFRPRVLRAPEAGQFLSHLQNRLVIDRCDFLSDNGAII